jgi:cyclopropane-fatty-acyl-phospholipid synthase
VHDLFGPIRARHFAVRYWDDSVETPPGGPVVFTLVIKRPGALRRMLLPPSELAIVEAYLSDDVDVEGDLEATADLGDLVAHRIASLGTMARVARRVVALPLDRAPRQTRARTAKRLGRLGPAHSRRRDREAVRFHYDVGDDFYALWLDRQMVYSCAYFEHERDDIDAAQTAKLDYVCRKLRLRPGERFLDIGCGWGALLIHAVTHYHVHALGITLSEQQAAVARERIAAAGIDACARVEVRDYRQLNPYVRYDKIASVGMVEHVGLQRLPEYFDAVFLALEPGGLFLNHGVVSLADARPHGVLDPVWRRLWRRDAFIRKYVFPDGDLVPAASVIASAESQGFETRDIESLREHYVMTLRHWVRRLEAHASEAVALVGERTFRVWRLYLSAAAHGFRSGRINVIQSLFAKPDIRGDVGVPMTRGDLYRPASRSGWHQERRG